MNILLTGGSGFIGKNLYHGLREKYSILSPTHRQLDLLDWRKVEQFIKKHKIKAVIHTAVEGGDNVLETSLRMFFSIFRNIENLERLINFGSGAVYGKTRDLKKVKETEIGRFIPEDSYGLAKLICSRLAKDNKKIVTLHPFGIFGPGEDYRYKFIANAIVKNLLGLPIKIKQNVIFDYLYIDDLIPIVDFFLGNKNYWGDYNVTPTKSISLVEIARLINSISKKPSKIMIINKRMNYQYTGDNNKLLRIIKIKPSPFKNSINKLFIYYRRRLKNIKEADIINDEYFKKAKVRI